MSLSTNYPTIRPSLVLDFANTGRLDPRISFTRASPAVYYDGVTTAKAEENLFIYSQEFDVGGNWEPANVTISANTTTAPDGTNTAELIYPTSTGTYRVIRQDSRIGQAVSIFAKAQNKSWIALGFAATIGNYTWFDLTNGVVGSTSALVSSATITAVGNGWYRCSVVFLTSQTLVRFMIADSNGSNTATTVGTDGIFVWGAQLEQRSSVTAYTATTTVPITNYIPVLVTAPDNTARFDYNPVTSVALGLLIEEARTNLLTNSEFPNGITDAPTRGGFVTATTFYGLTVAPGTGLAIGWDGVTTTFAYKSFAVTGSTLYTMSAYVKMTDGGVPAFGSASATNPANDFVFIVGSNSVSTTTYTVTAVGNGVYRVTGTITTAVSPGSNCGIVKYNTNSSRTFTISGYQLELGGFATSYIPTLGSSVPRNADSAVMTGTNFSIWYNSGEGALYQNFTALGVSATDRVSLRISDTAGPFVNDITFRNFSGTEVFAVHVGGLPAQASLTGPFAVTAGSVNRVAAVYKTNDFAFSMNKATATTDSSGSIPTVSQLSFPSSGCNYIRKVAYYPVRLTNAQLQNLTAT
jgi:hypothetical protein